MHKSLGMRWKYNEKWEPKWLQHLVDKYPFQWKRKIKHYKKKDKRYWVNSQMLSVTFHYILEIASFIIVMFSFSEKLVKIYKFNVLNIPHLHYYIKILETTEKLLLLFTFCLSCFIWFHFSIRDWTKDLHTELYPFFF